jgi:hypothetical protein
MQQAVQGGAQQAASCSPARVGRHGEERNWAATGLDPAAPTIAAAALRAALLQSPARQVGPEPGAEAVEVQL